MKEKRDSAAIAIQQTWRRRKAIEKQEKYQKENADAIVDVQSALRAHLARKKVVPSQNALVPHDSMDFGVDGSGLGKGVVLDVGESDMSSESSDAVEVIQSAMRAYLTRQMVLQDLRQRWVLWFGCNVMCSGIPGCFKFRLTKFYSN